MAVMALMAVMAGTATYPVMLVLQGQMDSAAVHQQHHTRHAQLPVHLERAHPDAVLPAAPPHNHAAAASQPFHPEADCMNMRPVRHYCHFVSHSHSPGL